MTLYNKDKFDIIEEEVVKTIIAVIEIDNNGILISREGGVGIYLEKKHFEQIIEKWNLFHHS